MIMMITSLVIITILQHVYYHDDGGHHHYQLNQELFTKPSATVGQIALPSPYSRIVNRETVMLSTVGPQPNQFSRCQSSRSKSLQHHESNSQNSCTLRNKQLGQPNYSTTNSHMTQRTHVTRCPFRRWQGHQYTWSMEGLTLRRELRIQATTSTMLTYTFLRGHLFLIKLGSTDNSALPQGYQYVEFREAIN